MKENVCPTTRCEETLDALSFLAPSEYSTAYGEDAAVSEFPSSAPPLAIHFSSSMSRSGELATTR